MTYALAIFALSGWLVTALLGVMTWRAQTHYRHLKQHRIHAEARQRAAREAHHGQQ
jgi:hypothetical protein